MKSYDFKSREDFTVFLEEEKYEFYSAIWESIDMAEAMMQNSAYIAEVYLEEEQVYIDMISDRSEWVGSLTLALNYCAEIEEYEDCIRIKKLISRIEDKTNS